jgi:urease accessory protein
MRSIDKSRMSAPRRLSVGVLAAGILAPTLALAHHPTGGMTPQSFWNGFLSGIGHPMLGPDHLAFIVGIGLLVAVSKRWMWLPVAFVATLLPGVLVHAAGVGIGPSEVIVACSVVLVGLALLAEHRISSAILIGAVMLAGFFHGYAFGETIVGAETSPLVAYLLGLSATILVMTMAISWGARQAMQAVSSSPVLARAAGGLLIVGGAIFTIQSLVV